VKNGLWIIGDGGNGQWAMINEGSGLSIKQRLFLKLSNTKSVARSCRR